MEWLSQNWTWIIVAVGAVWLFLRTRQAGGGIGGCCGGMAHEGPHGAGKTTEGTGTPPSSAPQASDQAAPAAAPSQPRSGCH